MIPFLGEIEERRLREARALQAAWVERAKAHDLLTRAHVDPGSLPERIADLIGQLHEARALLSAIARAQTTPTQPAAERRTEAP